MAKKQITQADLQKIANEIDNIGKENEAGHRQVIQTVAPPSKHTNEIYKKIIIETQERVKINPTKRYGVALTKNWICSVRAVITCVISKEAR